MSFENKKYGDNDAMYQWAWGVIDRGEIAPEKFSREALCELLQWNDRNGSYTDDISMDEVGAKMTMMEAVAHISDHITDSGYIKRWVRKLAKEATPLSYEDEGTERQVEAQWKLWDYMGLHCTREEMDKLESDSVKFKWSECEGIEECVKLIDNKYKEDE
jgi:hypothetical protein